MKASYFSLQLFSSCTHHLSLHLLPVTARPDSSHPSFFCFYLPLLIFFQQTFYSHMKTQYSSVIFTPAGKQRTENVCVRTYKRSMLTSFTLTVSLHPLTPIDLLRRICPWFISQSSVQHSPMAMSFGEWRKEWDCRHYRLELVSLVGWLGSKVWEATTGGSLWVVPLLFHVKRSWLKCSICPWSAPFSGPVQLGGDPAVAPQLETLYSISCLAWECSEIPHE